MANGVVLVGRKHAICSDCGAVLHVPWGEASNVDMALLGWMQRLAAGCALCGGRLENLRVASCSECEALPD